LFDAGFDTKFIGIASRYEFRWDRIIPDLLAGNFGDHNSYFSMPLLPSDSMSALFRLLEFALDAKNDVPSADKLHESLVADGINMARGSKVDAAVPPELAAIPGEKALLSYIQERLDKNELTSVLYVDLDGFKGVNDSLGHAEGDKCLIRVALKMSEAILGKGKLYRPHGDEFVIVLPNFTIEEAASTAQRIRSAVDGDNPGGKMKVTLSIGVVSSEPGQKKADALIAAADSAMYEAKRHKNHVAISK
jgi:diguanylate cyclase (GGDEF)-like protein